MKYTFGILILVLLGSCYQPEYHEPKIYLSPEAEVEFGYGIWEGVDTATFFASLSREEISFGILHVDWNKNIGATIKIHNNSQNKNFSIFNESQNLFDAIKLRTYRTSDSLWVGFRYTEAPDRKTIGTSNSDELRRWDDADPEYCEFILEGKRIFEGEIYLSGSFRARVYRSTDNSLTPAYHFYVGSFQNVLVKFN